MRVTSGYVCIAVIVVKDLSCLGWTKFLSNAVIVCRIDDLGRFVTRGQCAHSHPRDGIDPIISSQSRYDHFDIAPCLFPPAILVVSKALKNPLERKAGEKAKKYSIWIFGYPELARVFEGMKFPASAEISSAARYNHFDTLPCINIHLWGLITWFRAI